VGLDGDEAGGQQHLASGRDSRRQHDVHLQVRCVRQLGFGFELGRQQRRRIAVLAGSNISYTAGVAGTYTFTFNDSTLAYSVTPPPTTVPSTPTGVAAAASSSSQIDVTWTASTGATSYTVYARPRAAAPSRAWDEHHHELQQHRAHGQHDVLLLRHGDQLCRDLGGIEHGQRDHDGPRSDPGGSHRSDGDGRPVDADQPELDRLERRDLVHGLPLDFEQRHLRQCGHEHHDELQQHWAHG